MPNFGLTEDAPAAKLCEGLLAHGVREGYERIDLVPHAKAACIIRGYRKGSSREIMQCPRKLYPDVVSWVKGKAGLDPDKRVPLQEGTLRFQLDGVRHEVRFTMRMAGSGVEHVLLQFAPQAAA